MQGKRKGPNPVLTEAQVMQAYDMWCNGLTQKEIAKGMYVHENTISNSFRRYGLKKETPPRDGNPMKALRK